MATVVVLKYVALKEVIRFEGAIPCGLKLL